MKNRKLWWGYQHINGLYQAKRFFSAIDIKEANKSPFCALVVDAPFFAKDREEALNIVKEQTKK